MFRFKHSIICFLFFTATIKTLAYSASGFSPQNEIESDGDDAEFVSGNESSGINIDFKELPHIFIRNPNPLFPDTMVFTERINFSGKSIDSLIFNNDSLIAGKSRMVIKFMQPVDFSDSKFNRAIKIKKAIFLDTVYFDRCVFKKETNFSTCRFNYASFSSAKFYDAINFNKSVFYRFVDFDNNDFYTSKGARMDEDDFKKDYYFLRKAYFSNNCILLLGESFLPYQNIRLEEISKIIFKSRKLSDEVNPETISIARRILNDLLIYAHHSDAPENTKKQAEDWINYQIIQLDRKYSPDLFERTGLDFLYLTVNNGYHGGSRFFIIATTLIFIFSFIYYFGFKEMILAHLSKTYSDSQSLNQTSAPFEYIKMLWFSFVLFISPKFSFKHFNFNEKLQTVLILEWVLGLLLIIVYLIYIASQYSFVKALLGI